MIIQNNKMQQSHHDNKQNSQNLERMSASFHNLLDS